MCCNIGKNHTILCRHVRHKCYYEAKTNGQLLRELLAVNFQSFLPLKFKNIGVSRLYSRVTVHFMGTITRTSVYSPLYTAYWTLNYATMK